MYMLPAPTKAVPATTGVLLTPYKAAGVANVLIERAGLKKIPPQMVYNYTTQRINSDKTPLIPVEVVDGQVRISDTVITVWAQQYIAKKA
jgi:hypothetical protein